MWYGQQQGQLGDLVHLSSDMGWAGQVPSPLWAWISSCTQGEC